MVLALLATQELERVLCLGRPYRSIAVFVIAR